MWVDEESLEAWVSGSTRPGSPRPPPHVPSVSALRGSLAAAASPWSRPSSLGWLAGLGSRPGLGTNHTGRPSGLAHSVPGFRHRRGSSGRAGCRLGPQKSGASDTSVVEHVPPFRTSFRSSPDCAPRAPPVPARFLKKRGGGEAKEWMAGSAEQPERREGKSAHASPGETTTHIFSV